MDGPPRKLTREGHKALAENVLKFHLNPAVIYQQQRDAYLKSFDNGIFGAIENLIQDKMGTGDEAVFRGMDLLGLEDQRLQEIEREKAREAYANDNDWSPILKNIAPRRNLTESAGKSQTAPRIITSSSETLELFSSDARLNFTNSQSQPDSQSIRKSSQNSIPKSSGSGNKSFPDIPCAQPLPVPMPSPESLFSSSAESDPFLTQDLSMEDFDALELGFQEKRKQDSEKMPAPKRYKRQPEVADKCIQMPSQPILLDIELF